MRKIKRISTTVRITEALHSRAKEVSAKDDISISLLMRIGLKKEIKAREKKEKKNNE